MGFDAAMAVCCHLNFKEFLLQKTVALFVDTQGLIYNEWQQLEPFTETPHAC